MAIPIWSRYHYHTVLRPKGDNTWAGVADSDGSQGLVGSRPSVVVANGHVTMTRRWREVLRATTASRASFDGSEALRAVLREGDRLECWRDATGEIGLSVSRAGSLVLGLGTLGSSPGSGITIDHDPRVEDRELACDVHYIDQPDFRIVWLDPSRPVDLESRLRELDGDLSGVNGLAFVARTDDWEVGSELNRRTMHRPFRGTSIFLRASERFSDVDEWLQYGRSLSRSRPNDLWLRVRSGNHEQLIPEGTTATVDGWMVHTFRVYEPGIPGRLSQLGVVRVDGGVSAAMLEGSAAAIAQGLRMF